MSRRGPKVPPLPARFSGRPPRPRFLPRSRFGCAAFGRRARFNDPGKHCSLALDFPPIAPSANSSKSFSYSGNRTPLPLFQSRRHCSIRATDTPAGVARARVPPNYC